MHLLFDSEYCDQKALEAKLCNLDRLIARFGGSAPFFTELSAQVKRIKSPTGTPKLILLSRALAALEGGGIDLRSILFSGMSIKTYQRTIKRWCTLRLPPPLHIRTIGVGKGARWYVARDWFAYLTIAFKSWAQSICSAGSISMGIEPLRAPKAKYVLDDISSKGGPDAAAAKRARDELLALQKMQKTAKMPLDLEMRVRDLYTVQALRDQNAQLKKRLDDVKRVLRSSSSNGPETSVVQEK